MIGVILGDSEKDKNRLKSVHNNFSFAYNTLKLFMTNKENREFLKSFIKVKKHIKNSFKEKKIGFKAAYNYSSYPKNLEVLELGKL